MGAMLFVVFICIAGLSRLLAPACLAWARGCRVHSIVTPSIPRYVFDARDAKSTRRPGRRRFDALTRTPIPSLPILFLHHPQLTGSGLVEKTALYRTISTISSSSPFPPSASPISTSSTHPSPPPLFRITANGLPNFLSSPLNL